MSKDGIVRFSADEIRRLVAADGSQSDRARVDAMTDADIAAIRADDPDLSDLGHPDWAEAVAVHPASKNAISIRLDQDVVDFFKASGKGYQTRINGVLRRYMLEKLKNRTTG